METDLPALLPDDVLVDVLGRLVPRDLARSRTVCKAWCTVIDADHLLRTELLPFSLAGIFINFHGYYVPEFFSRPLPKGSCISSEHCLSQDDKDLGSTTILDHCNGLVLLEDYVGADLVVNVLNPATGLCASLPPCPRPSMEKLDAFEDMYLAYDPAVSPHYEVLSIPRFRVKRKPGDTFYESFRDMVDPSIEQSEWPPISCILQVFSSITGTWENRSFVREGEAAGIIADMRHWATEQRNAVYWQGVLYVHCQTDFVMRISLVDSKCIVLKRPVGIEASHYPHFYLGKSEKGVYCASFHERCQLRVWILKESCGLMEWELKHERNLLEWLLTHKLVKQYHNYGQQVRGPWFLQDINYYNQQSSKGENTTKALVEGEFEWSSEASDVEEFECLDAKDGESYYGYFDILGFHPYKEIIFLGESLTRGLAYHLNSSKVQVLGNLFPEGYEEVLPNEQFIMSSFPYTPCWMEHISKYDDYSEDHST